VVGGRSGSEFVSRLKKGIKMKKILAAILAGAFGLTAVAQTAVYDYKASFKRVNPVYKVRKVDKKNIVTESYGVSSDTITGYIILPKCDACVGGVVKTSEDNIGRAFLTRKGNKYYKTAKTPYVYKFNVWASSAIFGDNAYVLDHTAAAVAQPSATKDLKKASMYLEFDAPDVTALTLLADGKVDKANDYILLDKVIKNLGVNAENKNHYVPYGFLGLDVQLAWIECYGFGTAKVDINGDDGVVICTDTGKATPCATIQSISGSLVGSADYEGLCGAVPMWDLCVNVTTGKFVQISEAPLAGTWTLKFNKSLTKEGNAAAQETALLAKLQGKDKAAKPLFTDKDYNDKDWIYVDDDDDDEIGE